MKYKIYLKPPADFNSDIHVASCYCEFEDTLLLLKRHPSKICGDLWGVPAGKKEVSEDPKQTTIRELKEETGINVPIDSLQVLGILYIRLPEIDYVYHMYSIPFQEKPIVTINNEHTEFRWTTIPEAKGFPLMRCGLEALNYYSLVKANQELRKVSRVGTYGVAVKDNKILLITVKHPGCYGGLLDLPGGRIEFGETIEEGLSREFAEEVGMSFTNMTFMMNEVSNLAILHTEDHIHFHQIGLIYKLEGLKTNSQVVPEEEFSWYEIDSIDLNRLTPFAKAVLQELKRKMNS